VAKEIEQILLDIIDTAIAITEADFGNVQLLDPATGDLKIVAYRGFPQDWLNYWNSVSKGRGTCGTALAKGERVIIEDITKSPIFIGTPALDVQLKAGIRSVQSTPIIGRSGKIIGMFSTHYKTPHQLDQRTTKLLDVFAKQAAESIELLDTQILLKSILESSTEYSIMGLDLNGIIVAWNTGAQNLYGYHPSEIIGKSADPLYDPDELTSGKVQNAFDTALHTGNWSGVLRRIRKSRERFNVFLSISSRKDANNNVIGYTLISRDLTDMENVLDILNWLKTSEANLESKNIKLAKKLIALQNVDHLKSEFLSHISHELLTPLNGIIGFSEILYEGTIQLSSLKQKELYSDILSSARELYLMISEILNLTQLEANKFEFHPTKINLINFLNKIESTFHSLFIKKKVFLKIDIDPVLNDITIDPEQLRVILNNFISNALKFTPKGGQVNVNINRLDADNICLKVQDNGIGVRKKDLDKLFQKFQQLDTKINKKHHGAGLGLALVKLIVEAQGGQVKVESKLGKGSTFYAILPNK
jgi:PAS domain S-box-containing protein